MQSFCNLVTSITQAFAHIGCRTQNTVHSQKILNMAVNRGIFYLAIELPSNQHLPGRGLMIIRVISFVLKILGAKIACHDKHICVGK